MTKRKQSIQKQGGRPKSRTHLFAAAWIALMVTVFLHPPVYGQRRMWPTPSEPLHWRFVGAQGNRVSAVVCDSNDINVYYTGACAGGVWKSSDGGTNWEPVFDAQSSQSIGTLAIAPSDSNQVWAGSNDGLVHITRDGGKTWAKVTPPEMPPWGTVSMIEPSRFEAGRCYLAVDGHQENVRDPYLFKTEDYGRTWTRIDAGIPRSVLSYTSAVKEDPVRKGLLYAGTANAIYVSFDDGARWKSLQANLPHVCITWIAFQEPFNDLVVGTNGRGIWILDDVTPLQQLTLEIERADAHLFKPRPAYRFKARQRVDSAPNDQSSGWPAPYGASINYHLKNVSDDGVQIEILDENGDWP